MNGPVVLATPPAPGSAEPANLYVDLQSRALWLGVDPSVDPAGAVLISDIVQLEADIAAEAATARAYTDAQIVTRAPVVHSHVADDITDFDQAVIDAVGSAPATSWIKGMIVIWSGALSSIGVGPLAGWSLCDGGNGTPDLRDRFIIGAGNKTPGSKNPNTSFKTDSKGNHGHTVGNTAVTLAQMPAHQHWVQITGGTDAQGNHAHGIHLWSNSNDAGGHVRQEGTADAGVAAATEYAGNHAHNVSVAGLSDFQGSSATHTHSLTTDGLHDHTITSAQVRDVTPYYALAYIMRIV